MKIEICLESVESVIAAEKGGADRVEFCADLFEGGTTPSLGAFKIARKHTTIAMMVMIRPRGGDFCYSDLEFETMREDIRLFKEAGADGVVFGILNPDGTIDTKRSKELIELARPMGGHGLLEKGLKIGLDRTWAGEGWAIHAGLLPLCASPGTSRPCRVIAAG